MVKERTYSFRLSTDIDMHYKIEAPYSTPSTHSLNNSINIINKGMEHDSQEKEAQMLQRLIEVRHADFAFIEKLLMTLCT